jgi:hypothetical protein
MVKEIIDKADKGAFLYIEQDKQVYKLILGGILQIKNNWILYYSVFPEGMQNWHDCVCSNFKIVDQYGISFNDQWNRKLIVTTLEDYEKEEKEIISDWKKIKNNDAFKHNLKSFIEDRLNNQQEYIGDVKI